MNIIPGKQEKKFNILPKAMKTKERFTKKETKIAKVFNKIFADVVPELVSKIQVVTKDFKKRIFTSL